MNEVIVYKRRKGILEVFPAHEMVRNWVFTEAEEDEALLAHYMAAVAEKNGLSANDMMHLFPAVLRMLKSDITWANNIKPAAHPHHDQGAADNFHAS